jgi:two-component system, cell cycle response regulator
MPRATSQAPGGVDFENREEGTAEPKRLARSTAEALAENAVHQSERHAERETLIEGLRGGPAVSTAPPPRAAVFLRTDRRGCGQLLGIGQATTRLGRSWDADARIEDAGVSRVHAEVSADHGAFFITDLGSANGTYVNEQRIERAQLSDGSVVRLGTRVTLRFGLVEEDEKRALSYLHELGHYDPLTRVYNRRYLVQHLATELAFAERHQTSISIVLLDIDRFKQVNDEHGHQTGDQVLERVAGIVAAQVRTEDVVARYGGEEFMVVLRETPVGGAEVLGERIRRAVAETVITTSDGDALQVTLSAGCASLSCTGGRRLADLIQVADRRLYQAKDQGRNRVVGAGRRLASIPPPIVPELADGEPVSSTKPVDGLARAFDALPEPLRIVVGLHFQERCSFAEIAAITDTSEDRVHEMFQAALSKLREMAA